MDTINYTEQEVECVECSTIVPSSEAELTGTEGWGICDRCGDEEEELDANGNSNSDYKKAEKECPIGYIVVWNRWEKGFKYRKLDKDGYLQKEEELDAWCYRCDKFFSADTEEGGDDGTEEEEWVCNSCFKDIQNSSRIVEYK